MNTKMFIPWALMISAVLILPAQGSGYKEVPVGDLGYVVSVPERWISGALSSEPAMKLHMRVLHDMGGYSDFDVFSLDRNNLSDEDWIRYQTRENLPLTYGKFKLLASEEVRADSLKAQLFHANDLKNKSGYGLLEALVFTKDKVIFLRYLYHLKSRQNARDVMNRILASFTDASQALERTRSWYEEGRTLGLERFGLFLRLPHGWIPAKVNSRSEEVFIRSISGGLLRVTVFKRVNSGLKGLKKIISKQYPDLHIPDALEPLAFGTPSNAAFRFSEFSPGGDPAVECIFGLHGRGGYALVLTEHRTEDVALLHKVAARALLMNPREAEAERRKATAAFKSAVRHNDAGEARKALSTLVLFSDSKSTAGTIAAGLKAVEEIQLACATALGRMGSREANQALERALKNGRVSGAAKQACTRALDMARDGN